MSDPVLRLNDPVGDEVKQTTCYMCACRCGINVHLKDGQVRYIEGNPDHPVNRGVLCAKGSAGIMQHYSPARLRSPMLRVGERGKSEFKEISWDEALQLATQWLGDARAKDPDRLAFFTGRDQSQALTGWWAQQFGTINYAAHGGFCSVNMAAGGLYTLGGSFWEFGEPDWEHARYFMLWGVAEDHDSNPIKLGLGKLKARGAKIVAINPVRSGYGAIADEWVPIRPGSDGLLAFALIHELLRSDRIDLDYLVRYTNAHWLVIQAPGTAEDGMFARDAQGNALCWSRMTPPPAKAGGGWEGVAESAESGPHPNPPLQAGEGANHGAGEGAGDEYSDTRPFTSPPGRGRAEGAGEGGFAPANAHGISPRVVGEYRLPDGRLVVPVFHLLAQRYLDPQYSPDAVSERCGIPASTIRRLAQEMAAAALDSKLELPVRWTDTFGVEHASMPGRPLAMHAMRGISAHANGFHTCRALHVLQLLLGAVDTPGSFRYQPPFPRPIPPGNRPGKTRKDNGALDAAPLGFIHGPEDLLVDAEGQPRRLDHAYSWRYPLAVHGMLHSVIRHAHDADPKPVDVLMLFMANMSWNSAMNTGQTIEWLTAKDDSGAYRIPKIIYSDAYHSEMVAYADLILPDTTYLERHDCISLLDRPISDADGASDAIRHPVLEPDREVRGFQSVLLDIGARLQLPGMSDAQGAPLYRDFADYMVRHERLPGVGLLAGWRGENGDQHGKGAPNPQQLDRYIANGGFWHHPVPESARYYKMANRDYLQWSQGMGFIPNAEPIVLQLYSETLQKFRLAAQGHGPIQPPDGERERVARFFDPLPFWFDGEASSPQPLPNPPLRHEGEDSASKASAGGVVPTNNDFPLSAITQRPPFMYHAWGSQNAWLRQITARNFLYLHPSLAEKHGLQDEDWVRITSAHSQIEAPVKLVDNVQPDTVWTWNAIGKRRGAWKLGKDAPESNQGFLLNHLISDRDARDAYVNADPVTGQAAWFDLRVRIEKIAAPSQSAPQFDAVDQHPAPDTPLRYGAQFRKPSA